VNASPDGYTLLMAGASNAINATFYDKLNYNFIRDIAPVAGIMRAPLVMVVIPSFPAKTVPEFIAYAKANPGKINMASPGNGTAGHLCGELFKMMAGVDMIHMPYRGGASALAGLIGEQVQVMFDGILLASEHIKTGKLRGLAITTVTRAETLPDIPTVGEFVPGYEASVWFGVGAPRNTSPDVVDRLSREINAGLADPKIKAQLAEMGGSFIAGSPADFGRLIAEETEKWGKVRASRQIDPAVSEPRSIKPVLRTAPPAVVRP
jgi:tripartite-type tricarboxylate transporter receptor subunit TctC